MNSYRDLIVWQKAIELVKQIYALTKQLLKEEIFSLTSQRSAMSIPSGIAERYGYQHTLSGNKVEVLCLHYKPGSK
ncbi:MAG TPA: four helix bundle protein [Bacteroidales bacterium]|nr:four helix bundle protein [Bacteroidales bacterium]